MERNLTLKFVLIVVLVFFAIWTLYPPSSTLKPGLDLAGGTSLIYEIATQGIESAEVKGLSSRMITVLRRRIDPANIQNLVWRPQGNTRFEIQMPLADAETRQKRSEFNDAKKLLFAENVNRSTIVRALAKPPEERERLFQTFAQDANDRQTILTELLEVYDKQQKLQKRRDDFAARIETHEKELESAGLDIENIKLEVGTWATLKDQQLTDALTEFSADNLDTLERYVEMYSEWAKVVNELTDPDAGINSKFNEAFTAVDKLNLTEDQLNAVLEISSNLGRRAAEIEKLKTEFPDRAEGIDKVVAAFDEYSPYRGRLDDPADLQRMLKGAGILEFRILPTVDRTELTAEEATRYVNSLKEKGPRYASDNKYIWCELENPDTWGMRLSIVAPFGSKTYVLASNKSNEAMLHTADAKKDWKLKKASPGTEGQTGQRAIDFILDDRAGAIFGKITSANIGRPLCILLDGLAITAPNINSRITTRGQITGKFSAVEVTDMVDKLNAGSLPAMLIEQPISVKTIGPSIGADNRDQGIRAGLIGLIVVLICMAAYYTLAGSIADLALLMNLLFILAIMALVRATFTLPGIAGMILTIGMSVDANVLIFERIREEQQRGSSLRIAIRNGYQRAFRTILDANITTFITAAILYWVASEEIKGFAIVLMLGIASSMFTALFATRVIFDGLLSKRIIKDHLVMLRLIGKPNINWMGLRPVFITISAVLMIAGLTIFFTRDDTVNNKFDIEFTGGTSVTINLKEPQTRQYVQGKIQEVGGGLNNPALQAANVYSIGKSRKQYEITTTETNKIIAVVTFSEGAGQTPETIAAALLKAADTLTDLRVTANADNPSAFTVTTSQPNPALLTEAVGKAFPGTFVSDPKLDQVVNNAILTAFGDELEIQQNLEPTVASAEKIDEELIASSPEIADYIGGVKITTQIKKAATLEEILSRMNDLQFKPDMRDLDWTLFNYKILDSDLSELEPNQPVNSFVYVNVDPEAGYRQFSQDEWTRFVENEQRKITSAAQLSTSLPRVTQINPSVGAEAKQQAAVAIVYSLFAIVAYVWIRFGNVRYGVAAIMALVHDVCITLGAVTVCTYFAQTSIGEALLIGDFKINLAIIAAFLTLIGYSLNDTIVIFDRIRENRKKAQLTAQTITNSINQTISRTVLTSFTTFIVVLIMYIFGGQALRGFTFAIGFGILVGTYSSIAIAAPILLIGAKGGSKKIQ